MRPGVVALELEVFVSEAEDILYVGIDDHSWKLLRLTGELQTGLLQMVEVEMGVAGRVDEFTRLEPGDLRHHLQKESVGGDVEGHAKEGIGTALIELERQPSVGHVELEERVAGGEVHVLDVGHIP